MIRIEANISFVNDPEHISVGLAWVIFFASGRAPSESSSTCHRRRRDTNSRDTTRRDATRRDATRHDTTRREATRRDTKRPDATRNDTTRHDTTRRDTTRRPRLMGRKNGLTPMRFARELRDGVGFCRASLLLPFMIYCILPVYVLIVCSNLRQEPAPV